MTFFQLVEKIISDTWSDSSDKNVTKEELRSAVKEGKKLQKKAAKMEEEFACKMADIAASIVSKKVLAQASKKGHIFNDYAIPSIFGSWFVEHKISDENKYYIEEGLDIPVFWKRLSKVLKKEYGIISKIERQHPAVCSDENGYLFVKGLTSRKWWKL